MKRNELLDSLDELNSKACNGQRPTTELGTAIHLFWLLVAMEGKTKQVTEALYTIHKADIDEIINAKS